MERTESEQIYFLIQLLIMFNCGFKIITLEWKRSPRDPTKKSVSIDKGVRRGSSADSASTFVTARIQRVSFLSIISF